MTLISPSPKRSRHWGPYWGRTARRPNKPIKSAKIAMIWRTRRDSNSRPLPSESRACRSLHSLFPVGEPQRVRRRTWMMLWEAGQLRSLKDGADGGTRTRTPFEKQIFVPPRLSPPPDRRSWSGLSLRQGLRTVGATRLVSTPSPGGAWLGIGLGRTLSFPRL
jgi:hypothetical protein